MTLEDFEKSLAEAHNLEEKSSSKQRHKDSGKHHRHHRHHHEAEDRHRRKRRRRSDDEPSTEGTRHRKDYDHSERNADHGRSLDDQQSDPDEGSTSNPTRNEEQAAGFDDRVQRDAWMEEPSSLDVEFTQKGVKKPAPSSTRPSKVDFELKIHDNELNKHHLKDLSDGKALPDEFSTGFLKHEVDYHFGDAGARWRMTKLKGIYRRAEETGRAVDDVAEEQYGDLQSFDDAREEQIELDRRDTYGDGYVGKDKPSGELYEERKLDLGIRRDESKPDENDGGTRPLAAPVETIEPASQTVPLDQTALNRLKAQMLKAKVQGSSNAASLEAEFHTAQAQFANNKQSDVVVLGAMENRMLAGSRKGEVTNVENKRGRERGLVEENEDMSIEDMVKQERRTRHQVGGEGQRFAERIAKDAKFDNDLDYMDENATKLAKRVQKSEINLKNTAISDFQKMNRILDSCPLCHHEDTGTPPVAPVVSLATRVYLTLPTEPEISDGGTCIIPIQHRGNLLECDDDEWEEIRVGIFASWTLSIVLTDSRTS